MATATKRSICVKCEKETKAVSKCEGCSQAFCKIHFVVHNQELDEQLSQVEMFRNTIQDAIIEQKKDPVRHALIHKIDEWERDSIEKIKQTAEESRQLLLKMVSEHVMRKEIQLHKLTDLLKKTREDNDFVETEINQLEEQLNQLKQQLENPSHINLRQDSTPLVTKYRVDIAPLVCIPDIKAKTKWIQNGVTVAGGNGSGNSVNQLFNPVGLYVDDDQIIYVADQVNHRIMEWKSGATNGQLVAGGNGQGNRNDQLYCPTVVVVDKETDSFIISDYINQRVVRWPRRNGISAEIIISNIICWDLTMDDRGYFYVSDPVKDEVRRWKIGDTSGTVVAGGNGQGDRLDQLSGPTNIFVDQDHSVYISDSDNHRVMKWMTGAKEGVVVAGGQGQGNSLTQLSCPRGIVVDQLDTVYVADCDNHRIMRWLKGAPQGTVVVGENGQEGAANQLYNPIGLLSDRHGNFYVTDYRNHRVQKFNIDPSSTS